VEVLEDPELDAVIYAYDELGRIVEAARGASAYSYGYDGLGRLAMMTSATGETMVYGYDESNRITSVTLPSGSVIGYTYDANGNSTGVVMPSGQAHGLDYTPVDLMAGYTPPGGATRSREYNADGQPALSILPSGRTVESSYDASGRPTGVAYPEATVEYTYSDATLRMASITRTAADAAASSQGLQYSWDGTLITAISFTGAAEGSFTYRYDSNHFMTGMALAGAKDLDIVRDLDGKVTRIGDLVFTRGGPGGRTSVLGDGTLAIGYSFARSGKLQSRTHQIGGASVYGFALQHDVMGGITQRTETVAGSSQTFDYTYDADGQLLEVHSGGSLVERYAYDQNGNRTLREVGGASQSASYDVQDRLTAVGGVPYHFDDDGFLVQRGLTHFEYGSRGELLRAVLMSGEEITYAYDGLGRRVARADASGTEQYLYGDPSNSFVVTAVRGASGTLTLYFYDDAGLLVSMERDGARYYIATDQVGTPRVVSDGAGTVLKVMSFDSWGVLLDDSNPALDLPFGFAGGLADAATGLVRFGLRDYAPEAGRWTARDPILYGSGQVNLYAYSRNNPVGRRDPSGLACVGFSAFALFGAGVDVCVTTEGVSFCGEVGLGFGSGVNLDPSGALASRADADYVKGSVGAECLGIGAGFKFKLDDCGNVSHGLKASCGIGPIDPCAGKGIKLADVAIEGGIKNPLGKDRVDQRTGVKPKCSFGAKVTGGACWSSHW
jgi:RHS repeat-associated protein